MLPLPMTGILWKVTWPWTVNVSPSREAAVTGMVPQPPHPLCLRLPEAAAHESICR